MVVEGFFFFTLLHLKKKKTTAPWHKKSKTNYKALHIDGHKISKPTFLIEISNFNNLCKD